MKCLDKLALRVALAVILLISGSAEAATYAYRNDVFSYDTPSASAGTVSWHTSSTAPACTDYPQGDDDWADIVFASATTPANNFTFTFAGTVYSGVRVYSNGILTFGSDTSGQWRTFNESSLPYSTALGSYGTGCPGGQLLKAIIPYWTDIVAGTANSTSGAAIRYELLGSSPNRRLVISWANVKLYGQTTRYNFQVALYESPAGGLNSNFRFQYTTGSSTGSAATVGVQISTSDYTLFSYNQAFIDPTVGSSILWYPANQLAGKGAEYHFDEASWNGTAGEVKDTSGNGQDGVRVGTASNVATGKYCRGGSFTANTSNSVLDSVGTPITPGNVGSIDFWFNSNAKWNSTDATLLDATSSAGRPFTLLKTAAGALKFLITDSAGTVMTVSSAAQSFAAGTWHHVGATWNIRPGTNQTLLQIFLDGALTTSLRTTSNGAITPLSTLDIGDNASSGVTPSGGSPNGANGIIDEVNMYATEISAPQALFDMNASHACNPLDHFHVRHNGSAVLCDTTPVTIEAHDANHAQLALSGTTLTLATSLSHGNWSNVPGGSFNLISNSGNGAATYVFSNESVVTFGLQETVNAPESLVISATAGSISTISGAGASCVASDYTFGSICNAPLSFTAAGFIFSSSANGSSASIPTQVAGTSSPTYYLRAVQTNPTTGVTTPACTAALAGTTSVNFAYQCNNPLTCSAGNLMSINGGTATTVAGNPNSGVASYTAVPMTFDSNGNAPFTFNYSDAGQITLYAKTTGSSLTGVSNAFVTAPAAFAFSGVTASPIKAGNNFTATLSARSSTGAVTPNFGQETSPASVSLSFNKYQPMGGGAQSGSFSGSLGTFSNGTASATNLNWSEVGTIDLQASLPAYLGATLSPAAAGSTGSSGALRFIPDHFDTAVTAGCVAGGYSYSGQAFTVSVTARNQQNLTTQNYDGRSSGPNLTTPNFARAVTLSEANGISGTLSPTAIAASAFAAGVASLSPKFVLAGSSASVPPAPALIKLRAVEGSGGDGVSSALGSEGTAGIRSGRLQLAGFSGSEKSSMQLPVYAQYWSGNSWLKNSDDSCTVIPANAVGLTNYLNSTGGAGAWTTTASGPTALAGGYGTLALAAPLPAGSTGSVTVALNLGAGVTDTACLPTSPHATTTGANLPFLRGKNGSCSAATSYSYLSADPSAAADPSATATFGIFTPESKKLMHIRELY
ncbi:MAG: DUF6701 domain-containing protein [Bacteroidota bacterium]